MPTSSIPRSLRWLMAGACLTALAFVGLIASGLGHAGRWVSLDECSLFYLVGLVALILFIGGRTLFWEPLTAGHWLSLERRVPAPADFTPQAYICLVDYRWRGPRRWFRFADHGFEDPATPVVVVGPSARIDHRNWGLPTDTDKALCRAVVFLRGCFYSARIYCLDKELEARLCMSSCLCWRLWNTAQPRPPQD